MTQNLQPSIKLSTIHDGPQCANKKEIHSPSSIPFSTMPSPKAARGSNTHSFLLWFVVVGRHRASGVRR
eukprot:scaffold131467_cov85-Attheya_sp.AAC.3